MKTIYKILKYIFKNNRLYAVPKYLVLGFLFQVFSRLTNNLVSKKLFNGKTILLYPKCNISSMFAYTAIPDKKEIEILRNLLKNKNTIFFDIGANVGSYSVCVMDLEAEIVAFEPHPFTAKRCKMNFLVNNYSETQVKQIALSNQIGKIHFSDFGESSAINHILETNEGIEVETTTLDKFVVENQYPKTKDYVIKIDVEGYEKDVLEGAKDFLTNYKILGIVFECFDQKDVFEILVQYGFKNLTKLSENNYFATKN